MERYTAIGIHGIINTLTKRERELHDAVIACHKRQKNEHPRYQQMTDEEFKRFKVETIREFNRKRERLREEIKDFEKKL